MLKNTGIDENESWDLIIDPKAGIRPGRFKEVFKYPDLLLLLTRRDLVSIYKQTILGPAWLLVQPIIKTAIFYFIFGRLLGLSTDGLPAVLFYLLGITFWDFFAANIKRTADTFTTNSGVFGKVYFPRLVVPAAAVLANAIKALPGFLLFIVVWAVYAGRGQVAPNYSLVLLPVLILALAAIGLGAGLLLSSISAKFRDLRFILDTGIQVLFYLSPVIYPMGLATDTFADFLFLNPLAPILECLRFMFLGKGYFSWAYLFYSGIFAAAILSLGIFVFRRTERNFIDTV